MSELVKKTSNIIKQFTKRNIITKSEKFFDAPKKITESLTEEKSKKESDQPISNWIKLLKERFNLIKQIINKNKDLGTTINNNRYTLNDANDLVNKIAKKRLATMRPLIFTMI